MRFAGLRGVELKIALPLRQQPDDVWEQLLALAEAASPATKKRFLDAIAKLRDDIDLQALEDAISNGDVVGVLDAVPWDDLKDALAEIETALEEVRANAFELSRNAAEPYLDPDQLALHLGDRGKLTISFRHVSPYVLEAIQANTAKRITGIVDETRAAIRQIVERAYAAGEHARSMIPAIKQTIGLTSRQELAVARYRASLEADGVKRPAERVDRMVARYRNKLLKYRAELIARTETIQAMNDGQRAAWQTLVARGLLDENRFEREWIAIVPTDGRTCPICESLDGARAPINGDYAGAGAGGPPQHPDCRCTEKLVPKER